MSSRSRGRQFALQMLYQIHFSGYPLEEVIPLFWRELDSDQATKDFCEALVKGVLERGDQLDLEIGGYLKSWSLSRIATLDRYILQIAFYELTHTRDVPWKVVIDEAVGLAKGFSTDKSPVFINGVLHAWSTQNGLVGAEEPAAQPEAKP